ncbi:MAG: TonB family protein [Kofleriaceae bacterium]|nr:TonB family protein [Kofleriaceae bacterium]
MTSVRTFDLTYVGEAFSANTAAGTQVPGTRIADLKTTCRGDVLLATSARAAMCLAPWKSDVEACGNDVAMQMWMDLSACEGLGDESLMSAPVALLEPKAAEKLKPIDPEPLLELLDEQEKQKPPEIKPPDPQVAAQPPPPPPPPAQPRPAQVVEVVKPQAEKAPENARLLSEYDVSVEKQKVDRGSAKEPLAKKSAPEELVAKKDPQEASMKELPEQAPGKNVKAPDAPGTLSMRAPGAPAPAELPQDAKMRGTTTGERGPIVADGFIPRRGSGAIEQLRREQGELPRGEGGAGGGAPQVPNLKPSQELLERAVGGGSVDHLEDVEEGDETSLSAKKWVYATFFNRLKRSVAQNWDPATVWRRSDPNGTVHGFKTRVTEVRVSLSPKGDLAKIVVTNPSGVSELDDEAVRSFHAAAPFPNPPDGLIGKEGLITFAFSFYFEIGQPRTSWRVIRQ